MRFLREILQAYDRSSMVESLHTLLQEIVRRTGEIFAHATRAGTRFNELQRQIHILVRNNQTLRFVQFAGEREAAAWQAEAFGSLFEMAHSHIESTHVDCMDMGKAIQGIRRHVETIHAAQPEIDRHTTALEKWLSVGLAAEAAA